LRSLRKDADGVVARFDRYISLATSRRLMALPIRPNHVTAFAALVGLLCGLVAAHGGYLWMLFGALGFQANSILDGIDGEIARAKLLESSLGQWLDTLADDFSNLVFMVGVSVGCYRTNGSKLYLVLGAVAAGGFLFATAFMYHYLVTRVHSGDLNDFAMPWEEGAQGKRDLSRPAQGLVSRFLARVKWLVRRDTYVFICTVLGLLGQLRIMVWLFALGSTATWTSIFAYRTLMPMFRRAGGPKA
jgi:phosphatidylglycerophosphate synthase